MQAFILAIALLGAQDKPAAPVAPPAADCVAGVCVDVRAPRVRVLVRWPRVRVAKTVHKVRVRRCRRCW